jgi:hypothetical protein
MSTVIQVDEGVKNRLQLSGREGESYDEILNRLMDSLEELDVKEIIEARWLKLQKEKKGYIPPRRCLDGGPGSSSGQEIPWR